MVGIILLIEDDDSIARLLGIVFENEGYRVVRVGSGNEGLEKAIHETWDLILLDIILPGLNGLEVLRRIRNHNITTPVLLLTAKNETMDLVIGLDRGADDYITKPFEIEELLARIRVAMRKGERTLKRFDEEPDHHILQVGHLKMNLKTREVIVDNRKIELTPKEFDLVFFLLQNKGKVMSREEIVRNVWRFDFMGDTNIVDVYIRYVRKKIDSNFKDSIIHTVRGVGYCIRENN